VQIDIKGENILSYFKKKKKTREKLPIDSFNANNKQKGICNKYCMRVL
jgi:hypothetical protein